MPDPSHRPYQPMHIIKPDSLPRFWWLFPWTVCRQLHKNAVALRSLCDRQDDVLTGKVQKRPRWSIFISGLPGPERRYLFKDNDYAQYGFIKHGNNLMIGEMLHYDGPNKDFTSFRDPEDAIKFCDHLNAKEVQS